MKGGKKGKAEEKPKGLSLINITNQIAQIYQAKVLVALLCHWLLLLGCLLDGLLKLPSLLALLACLLALLACLAGW